MSLLSIVSGAGTDPKLYEDALSVRQAVFVQEQHITPELELDQWEQQAYYYVGYLQQQPVVTARIIHEQSDSFHIQRVATLPKFRRQGLATNLLTQLIHEHFQHYPNVNLELNAQLTALSFYKQLGFQTTSTPAFKEAGILHQHMLLTAPKKESSL